MSNRRRTRCQIPVESVEIPSPESAYYKYPETGNITSSNMIPLNEVLILSPNIFTEDNYSIRLNNGVYRVSFSLVARPNANGSASAALYVNNSNTNIASSASINADNSAPLSALGIIVASADSTILSLRNFGNLDTSYSYVNLVIRKIA